MFSSNLDYDNVSGLRSTKLCALMASLECSPFLLQHVLAGFLVSQELAFHGVANLGGRTTSDWNWKNYHGGMVGKRHVSPITTHESQKIKQGVDG